MVSLRPNISVAYLNANYLKLDCSNDPLTGTLDGANLDFTGHMALGANASVSATTILAIDETLTTIDTTMYGVLATLDLQPSGALGAATHLIGWDSQARWTGTVDGSVHGSVQGIKGEAVTWGNTQPINQLIGVYGKANNLGQQTVTEAIGGLFFVGNDDASFGESGDLTNAYSIVARAYTDKDTGVIGTRYGLYIEDTTGGGLLTDQYGIYCPALAGASGDNLFIKNISADSDFGSGAVTTTGIFTMGGLVITPPVDGVSILDINQADGTPVVDVDTVNRKLTVTSGTTGQSTIGAGLIVNNDSGSGAINDFQVNSDTLTAILVDASADTMVFGVPIADKIMFTQADGNEYIDSLADGYMDYRATTAHRFGDGTNQLVISNAGVLTLEGTAKRWMAVRPDLDYTVITAQGKPTQVTVGVFHGYSMPVYNSDNEELFFNLNVPGRWDETSDIIVHLLVALSGAEDIGDYFKFQLSWEHLTEEDAIPVTSHDVEVEQIVLTGRTAQYSIYELIFTLDYDVDDPDNVIDHDDLAIRVRRIDATNPDVTNEIIVLDYHVEFQVDKMFDAVAG